MWKTTNYNGEQVWYSEEEYEALKQEIKEKEEIIENLERECKKLKKEILNERINT